MVRGFKKAWYLALTFLGLSFSLSLEEAQEYALKNFSEVKLQAIELEKKRQDRLEKLGKFMPTINMEASFNIAKKQSFSLSIPPSPPQEFVFIEGSYPKFTLQVVQEVFNLRNFREYELAKKGEEIQSLMVEEVKNRLIYKVREAYVNVLRAKALVDIYSKHRELLEAHLSDVKELYKSGVVAFKDVLETKVKLYEVKEKLSKASAELEKAKKYLSYITGAEVENVEELSEKEYKAMSREELVSKLKENRPLLKYMARAVELSEGMVSLSKAYFYPTASIEAFYQRTEESDLFPKDRYLLSFVLRWNLFSGLRRFRAVELSKLTHMERVEQYRDIERKLILELDTVLADLKAVESKIEMAEQQLESAREHLRVAREKYRAGLGTNTEVLDAQSYLITAENTLRLGIYDKLLRVFKLKEVIGDEL